MMEDGTIVSLKEAQATGAIHPAEKHRRHSNKGSEKGDSGRAPETGGAGGGHGGVVTGADAALQAPKVGTEMLLMAFPLLRGVSFAC